jgi:hypothetical protein
MFQLKSEFSFSILKFVPLSLILASVEDLTAHGGSKTGNRGVIPNLFLTPNLCLVSD